MDLFGSVTTLRSQLADGPRFESTFDYLAEILCSDSVAYARWPHLGSGKSFFRPSAPVSMLRLGSGTGAIFFRSTVIARRWPSPLRLWCVKLRSKSRSLDLRIAPGA